MNILRSEILILALPKGRILDELIPLMKEADIIPEKAFFDTGPHFRVLSDSCQTSPK